MKIKILILLTTLSTALNGQKIYGRITDARTSEALPGANVVLSTGSGNLTDEHGEYSFSVQSGKYQMEVFFIGYKTFVTDTFHVSDEDFELNISLLPQETQLGEVVVSAGKFEQRLEEVTVSLDVIKPALVQDKNLVNLRTTLQQAPGVNVTDGQANIRGGSGWSYGAGTRVQTLVDGMPLISGDANQVLWELVPIHSVERLEVLKGASSVLYGSAALNGVINVLTHSMPDETSLSVNLYSGIYDTPKRQRLKWWDEPRFNSGFNFDYRQPVYENNALVLSGGHIQDQGFRYLDDEKRSRLFAKYLHNSTKIKGLEASLATNVMYSDIGNALLWESDSLGYIPADSSITRSFGWDFYIDPSLSYRHGSFKHTLQGRYIKVNNNTFDEDQDFSNSSDLYFGQYQLQYFLDNLVTTFGASTTFALSQSVLFAGTHSSTNNAAFLQLDYKPFPRLNLNGGIRYEAFRLDSRFDEKPVFRAGANFTVTKGTFLRTSYGEAFRFPSVAEAYTTTSVGMLQVLPNPNLQAETGQTMEAGIRQMFYSKGISGYLDFAVFQMRYYDMIEYNASFWGPLVPPNFGLGFAPLNIGETTIKGFEFAAALDGKINPKLNYRLIGGYTYSLPQAKEPEYVFAVDSVGNEKSYLASSSDPENNILKYRYQHIAKIDAQVEYRKLNMGFSIRYNDFMQNIDDVFLIFIPGVEENRGRNKHGDLIVDLRTGVSFAANWRADLIIENLFNREVMIRPAYLGPPRSVSLRINYRLPGN